MAVIFPITASLLFRQTTGPWYNGSNAPGSGSLGELSYDNMDYNWYNLNSASYQIIQTIKGAAYTGSSNTFTQPNTFLSNVGISGSLTGSTARFSGQLISSFPGVGFVGTASWALNVVGGGSGGTQNLQSVTTIGNQTSASVIFLGGVTGSSFTGSFRGNLFGTSSQAISASYSVTASYVKITGSNGLFVNYGPNGIELTQSYVYPNLQDVTTLGNHTSASVYISSSLTNGFNVLALGQDSHAEGFQSTAIGDYSHAEGRLTTSTGQISHTEGNQTLTTGQYSHAEGELTTADGQASHAEGESTTAGGNYSHAEGSGSLTVFSHTHAEGLGTTAGQFYSHAEGILTLSEGVGSHAEGFNTTAVGETSHVEGYLTTTLGYYSHAEGELTLAFGTGSHAEGTGSLASGSYSHAEGYQNIAKGVGSHAEGYSTTTVGDQSHAEGVFTTAVGFYSHAEGTTTIAAGLISHAEGTTTTSKGDYSHAEGANTTAVGESSHAEGLQTKAIGTWSHAEGYLSRAIGNQSHAEGGQTTAIGDSAHSEGAYTTAKGDDSHAEGLGTIASIVQGQHVEGKWNIEDSEAIWVVGNGSNNSNRRNLIAAYSGSNRLTVSGSLQVTGSIQSRGPVIITGSGNYLTLPVINTSPNSTNPYNTSAVPIGSMVIWDTGTTIAICVKRTATTWIGK